MMARIGMHNVQETKVIFKKSLRKKQIDRFMKLNLESLEVYTSIDKQACQVVNARKEIANLVYNRGNGLGLSGIALATKMWNGSEETEYTEDEVKIIQHLVTENCAPCFIEAVNGIIDK